MPGNRLGAFALKAYSGLWRAAMPLLRRNRRLAQGWQERLAQDEWRALPASGVDLWLHGASGGEARLAETLLAEIASFPDFRPTLLLTACTAQGMDILRQAAQKYGEKMVIETRYFPLDEPATMERALEAARPRLIALLETEIWPALLLGASRRGIPVFLLNGRLTPRAARGYALLPASLRRAIAPKKILPVSRDDGRRFREVFATAEITPPVPNIKFDRITASAAPPAALAGLEPRADAPVIVFGSMRGREAKALKRALELLKQRLPGARLVVVPRHLHRAAAMRRSLEGPRTAPVLLSRLAEGEPIHPGAIVIWDRFGELPALYAAAQAAFVGGSLAPLGGQNFLEPLAAGLTPCVGPWLDNFAWTGPELFAGGLVHKAMDAEEAAAILARLALSPPSRKEVRRRFQEYLNAKKGGAAACAALLRETLAGASGPD